MHASLVAVGASLLTLTSARAIERRDDPLLNVLYWGAAQDNGDLASFCSTDEGVDVVVLAFLDTFGNGQYPHGYLGDCSVNSDGTGDGCETVSSAIKTCQGNGKKVFVSVGGGGANWSLTSKGDAEGVAYSLWNSYAAPGATDGKTRPLGDAFVDGWDFDLEDTGKGNEYLPDLVNALRSDFGADTEHSYYISGAPQCPDTNNDASLSAAIQQSQFDYLWIQFYNNYCSASDVYKDSNNNPDGSGSFNLADWPGFLSGTSSANAKLIVGLPGNEEAADAGKEYDYVSPSDLSKVVDESKKTSGFAGVMVFQAGQLSNDNGCDYAKNVRSVLDNGSPC